MIKRKVAFLVIMVLFLTGCDALKPGVESYTLPDETLYDTTVESEAKRIVERLAEQEHVKPSLSDEFIKRYLDMDSFDELKQRTRNGIAAVNNTADMTESEFQLWKDIIETERLNMYTTDDLEAKKQEIQGIMESIAYEKGQELKDFLLESYKLTPDETESFISSQAEKFIRN